MSAPRKCQAAGDGKKLPGATQLRLLPAKDREEVYGWCLGEETLAQVRARIKERFDISLSADSQLTRFKDWQFHQQRIERLNSWTEELEESLKRFNPAASMDQVRQFVLATLMKEAMASGDGEFALQVYDRDLSERTAQTRAELEKEKISLSARKVKLLEEKAKQAEQAKEVLGSGLSVEEQNARLREILK